MSKFLWRQAFLLLVFVLAACGTVELENGRILYSLLTFSITGACLWCRLHAGRAR